MNFNAFNKVAEQVNSQSSGGDFTPLNAGEYVAQLIGYEVCRGVKRVYNGEEHINDEMAFFFALNHQDGFVEVMKTFGMKLSNHEKSKLISVISSAFGKATADAVTIDFNAFEKCFGLSTILTIDLKPSSKDPSKKYPNIIEYLRARNEEFSPKGNIEVRSTLLKSDEHEFVDGVSIKQIVQKDGPIISSEASFGGDDIPKEDQLPF